MEVERWLKGLQLLRFSERGKQPKNPVSKTELTHDASSLIMSFKYPEELQEFVSHAYVFRARFKGVHSHNLAASRTCREYTDIDRHRSVGCGAISGIPERSEIH